jgi:hypothetical protein
MKPLLFAAIAVFTFLIFPPLFCQVEEGELLYLRDPNPRFHGRAVEELQKFLVYEGFNIGPDGVDGWFGKDTEKAVKAYQESLGSARTGRILYGRFPRDLEWKNEVIPWEKEELPEADPGQIKIPESETGLSTYYGMWDLPREDKGGVRYFEHLLSPSGRYAAYRYYHPQMDPSAGMPVYVYDILTEKQSILYPFQAAESDSPGLAGGAFSEFYWINGNELLLKAYLVYSDGSEKTIPVLFRSLK